MENNEWTPVAVRVFAFSVLPVLLAALHLRLDTSAKDRLWKVEVYLIYLFMLGMGAGGLSGFVGHVFTPDAVAEPIDWPKGSPFQQEMGFANLALAVLGLIAAGRRDGFREATVIAVTIVGVGATVVHVRDIVQVGNLAPGNSIQNVANLLRPGLLIAMLIVSRRSEHAGAPGPPFDRWRMTIVGAAGMVTAVVGTGFGIGYSLELTVPATLSAALLAGGIVARSASISRDSQVPVPHPPA
jgi:hypothetical protein